MRSHSVTETAQTSGESVLGIEWVRPGPTNGFLEQRTANWVSAAVLSGYFLIAVAYVWEGSPGTARALLALAAMSGIFVCQLCTCLPGARPAGRRWRLGLFAVQTLLTYLPVLRLSQSWLCTLGFLAGSALLVLPELSSLPVFVTVVLSTDGLEYWSGRHGGADLVVTTVTTAVTGLVVFGQSRIAAQFTEMQHRRAEAARMAVEEERQRFSRDLHDLLGYSLSTITLKCALAQRALPPQSSRAAQELTEVQQLSRQVMADVRAVSHRYRRLSLSSESESAQRLLTQAGVTVSTQVNCPQLSPEADTLLSTVLRESVTNMLWHSRLRRCTVEAVQRDGLVRLTVANDGVDTAPSVPGGSGSGLGNLRARVEGRGGRFTARRRPDGWFELTAELDLTPVPQGA